MYSFSCPLLIPRYLFVSYGFLSDRSRCYSAVAVFKFHSLLRMKIIVLARLVFLVLLLLSERWWTTFTLLSTLCLSMVSHGELLSGELLSLPLTHSWSSSTKLSKMNPSSWTKSGMNNSDQRRTLREDRWSHNLSCGPWPFNPINQVICSYCVMTIAP